MKTIQLTLEEAQHFYAAGRERDRRAVEQGCNEPDGTVENSPQNHGMAVVAEATVAKTLGTLGEFIAVREYSSAYYSDGDIPGGYQVRWTRHWGGRLRFNPRDKIGECFIGVFGEFDLTRGTVNLMVGGWIYAWEACRVGFWQVLKQNKKGDRKSLLWVDQDYIHSMNTLPKL